MSTTRDVGCCLVSGIRTTCIYSAVATPHISLISGYEGLKHMGMKQQCGMRSACQCTMMCRCGANGVRACIHACVRVRALLRACDVRASKRLPVCVCMCITFIHVDTCVDVITFIHVG